MVEKAAVMKKTSFSLKKDSLSAIRQILVTQYAVSKAQANQMLRASGILDAFNRNAEMAAHTSYRTWAKRAYDHAKMQEEKAAATKLPLAKCHPVSIVVRGQKVSHAKKSPAKRA
ncbi:MAG: hypothetical protein NC543_10885 [bacterium]|nr:hypothetical protein [bacterium]MCM1374682.1 hypothetical protein [Muribaculum sp.]